MATYKHGQQITVVAETDKKNVNGVHATITEHIRNGVVRRSGSNYVYHDIAYIVGSQPSTIGS